MKKSDLNNSMIFKLRGRGLCVLLDRHDNNRQVFYNQGLINTGSVGGQSSMEDYSEDLLTFGNYSSVREYDIIAIKQCKSCTEAINMVLNDKEPEKWDWIEEVEKAEPIIENIIQNFTINISIDSKTNIEDFVAKLKDNFDKMKYPGF